MKQPIELTVTTHDNTVSWFILSERTHNISQYSMKNSTRKTRSLFRLVQFSFSHVFIALGSPRPNLIVLLKDTKLWGVVSVNLSYTTALKIVAGNVYNQP